MLLRILDSIAGHRHAFQPGDVVRWPDELAAESGRMIDAGQAEEISEDAAKDAAKATGRTIRTHRAPPETATRRAPEKAAVR